MSSAPGTNTATFGFFLITTLYFPLRNAFYDASDESNDIYMFLVYFILTVIIQYFVNLSISNKICKEVQWGLVLSITLAPWFFVFGILILMLHTFPGWLRPFSNTFGYGLVSMLGITDIFTKIFKTVDEDTGENKQISENLAKIYSDKSVLINEISYKPDEFIQFWNNTKPLMKRKMQKESITLNDLNPSDAQLQKPGFTESSKFLTYELFKFVRVKYLVSQYIWYLLGGFLAIMISYSYMINGSCSISAKEMETRHKDMVSLEKNRAEEKNKANPRVYKNYGD